MQHDHLSPESTQSKMEATAENLSMLSTLLTQSLSAQPEIRHPAEKNLNSTELQPGFLLLVLTLVSRTLRVPFPVRHLEHENIDRFPFNSPRPIAF
jgi:hypothetical protein